MIKLIWFIFKELIWGRDIKVDLSLMLSFNEALDYLNAGYFIYPMDSYTDVYFMVNSEIYCLDLKKQTCQRVGNFNVIDLKKSWKAIPQGKQVEEIERD